MKLRKKNSENEVMEVTQKSKKGIPWLGRFLKRHKGMSVLIVIVIVGAVVGVNVFGKKGSMPTNVPTVAAFQTTTLEKRDISNSISVTGTIASADSRTMTTTLSNIDVKALNVAVGDQVNAGDTLVVFDDSDLAEDLADAKTSLSVSKEQTANNLESAQRSYDEATESATIQASRAASTVSSSYTTYTNAVATEASSKTAYQEAVEAQTAAETAAEKQEAKVTKLEKEISELQTDLKTAEASEQASIEKKIAKKQESLATAKQTYETKSAALKEAEQATATAKQTYEQAATALEQASSSYTKAVQEQEDTTRNNESNLANQASSLENTKLNASTGSKNEEEQVESIQEQIDSCTVTAPISGVITSLSVEAEETFAGGEILVIQDNSDFIVEASVDEYDIADIAKGMTVVVKTDATGDEELEGEVIYVAPTPTSSTGSSGAMAGATSSTSATYEVQISIKTANDRLRIGMSAKASILTDSREDVFAVPYDAIETTEDGKSVIYVVDGVSGGRGGFKGNASKPEESTEQQSSAQERDNQETTETSESTKTAETTETAETSENAEAPKNAGQGRPEMPQGDKTSATDMTQNRKAIEVEVGMESDYYTEIISDELEEGMLVITGTTSTKSSTNTQESSDISSMFPGMSGGGNSGMGSGRGGMSGGGMGGGRP